MTIEVTADDINQGTRFNCAGCPVALALSRTLEYSCKVGLDNWWPADNYEARHRLPPEAKDWRTRYDRKKPVLPFTFEMEGDE